MLRVVELRKKGYWSGPAADTVVLGFHDRHRRRMSMSGCNGLSFLLDLARATVLRDGDGLVLEDGRLIVVRAAAEPLLRVTGRDATHLARLAWHIGNRHLPAEIRGDCILIQDDHVIAEMVRGLGGEAERIEHPFDPEGGAYAHGEGGHAHDHGHGHGHDDGHGHHGHG